MKFCDKLRYLRESVGYGFNEFWKDAKISNVYLSGLENGSKPPPPHQRQMEFIKILNAKKNISEKDMVQFYDLAARERKELPADIIANYGYNEAISEIRKLLKEKNNEK